MTKHLRADLEKLEKGLLALGGRVEEAVRRSISALETRRADLAIDVINGDVEIDRDEVALEEECLKILALHQPVAGDLRFIAACLKITNDLERIGDLAVNIAKRASSLDRDLPMPQPPNLEAMTEAVAIMLRDALDAFVRGDVEHAYQVMLQDDEVDNLHRKVMDAMMAIMRKNSDHLDDAMLFISASRHLERIADHATNIAEDVVYMVDGGIIRHQGAPREI